MSDESDQFRRRANDCRNIAGHLAPSKWRDTLIEIAGGLEEEASGIEAEEMRSNPMPPIAE